MSPKTVGEITEARVLAALLQAGAVVLTPFGDNQRYDLVIENDGVFKRVQCKTGRLRNGTIVVNGSSISAPHRGGKRKDYRGSADLFGVYCPDTDECYLVPVDEVPVNEFRLRVDPVVGNNPKAVRMAAPYRITRA